MKLDSGSGAEFIDQDTSGHSASIFEKQTYGKHARLDFAPSQLELHAHTSQKQRFSPNRIESIDYPLFLVTMYKGIGDAVLVGSSFIDQIIKEDPQAFGKIDILCNSIQAEIFEH